MKDTNDAQNWTLDKVTKVSKAIDDLAATNEPIGSIWPGYIFASKADAYPGLENDFGWVITSKLTSDQRTKYHILGLTEIETDFAAHTPRIAVVGNGENSAGARLQNTWKILLRSNGYTAALTIGDTSVFVYCIFCKSQPAH